VLPSAFIPRFARLARRSVLAIALVMAPLCASATPPPVPGADDPAFDGAMQLWLADDEQAALPEFARLAQDGNIAARILLGLIDKIPALQGAYLAHLARPDRLEVMRAPGGFSGSNWLTQIDDLPLANAWRALWDVSAGIEVIRAFHDLGEPGAARRAMIYMALRNHPSMHALTPEQTDPELLYLLWPLLEPSDRSTVENMMPTLHPQRVLIGQPLDARVVDTWLDTSDAASPIAALCDAVCPDTGDTCRGTAYRALNSHNALLSLGTPSAALVSQAEFLASARGRASVMRRILLAVDLRGRRTMFAYMQEHSQCLADALIAENQRYMPRLTQRSD